MKRAGPGQYAGPGHDGLSRSQHLADNGVDASSHFLGSPAREGEQQNPLGRNALNQQVRHPVRERHRLTRAGTGDNQKRACDELPVAFFSPGGSLPLCRIQCFQVIIVRRCRLHCHTSRAKVCIFIQYWINLQAQVLVQAEKSLLGAHLRCRPFRAYCMPITRTYCSA